MVAGRSKLVLAVGATTSAVAAGCVYALYKDAMADINKVGKDGTKAPDPTTAEIAGKMVDKIKIVDVLRFTSTLIRDLLNPERLAAEKKNTFKRLLAIVWPSYTGKENSEGRNPIFMLFGIAIFRTWLMDRTATMTRTLAQKVFAKGTSRFGGIWKECLGLVVLSSGLSAVREYCSSSLTLVFRHKLTKHIQDLYFQDMNYYHIANAPGRKCISNADELVASQVHSVAKRLSAVIQSLLKSLPPIVWFTFKLWRWQGVTYAMIPHLYLLLAYEGAQRLFPKDRGLLWKNKMKDESAYKQLTSRIVTHSESITALDGFAREKVILGKQFDKVVESSKKLIDSSSKFDLIFKLFYSYGCRSWITSFMMLPILNAPASTDVSAEVAAMRYSYQMLIEMLVANGNVLDMHARAMMLERAAYPICRLIDGLKASSKQRAGIKTSSMMEGDHIKFEGAQIMTPDERVLVQKLSFELQAGQTLLLTGHNGAGKSSIFRVLGGLWPTTTGKITKPGASSVGLHQDIFYLPQKPYNVLGSLKANIVYPRNPVGIDLPLAKLRELLDLVDLTHLLEGYDTQDQDTLVKWEDKLSLGEQQRLAMARLFFHCPKFAILDECTSAVSTRMEVLLYQECRRRKIAYITICHRPALRAWHDMNLNLLGEGKYVYEAITKTAAELETYNQAQVYTPGENSTTSDADERLKFQRERSVAYQHMKKVKPTPKRSSLSKFKKLIKLMLPGSLENLGVLVVAVGLRTLSHELYTYIVGMLYQAMINRDVRTFTFFSAINVASDLSTACVEQAVSHLQEMLGLSCFRRLTEYTSGRLFESRAFYRLRNLDKRIQDPDQRLTSEIEGAASEFAGIWASAITPAIDIVWFSYRMYSLTGASGMRLLYAYIMLSVFVIKTFIPDHGKLETREKQEESTFRFIHNRLRNHCESVAFFGGDQMEASIATQQFETLMEKSDEHGRADAEFKFMFHMVTNDSSDPSSMLSMPDLVTTQLQSEFIDGLADGTPGNVVASEIFYLKSASDRAISAFGKLSSVYEHVSKLIGSATRLCELFDVLDDLDRANALADAKLPKIQEIPTDIAMENVDLVTPNGECLASGVNLRLSQGDSLMITGPNAAGKTSFFRVLSGLWPLPKGGSLSYPEGRVQLVPQRVYSVVGTFSDQVTYPKHTAKDDRTPEEEERMKQALSMTGVDHLLGIHKWDDVKRWEDTLSLGEQQRIGLARLFYHKPGFCVLDECTDAVSAEVEEEIYRALHANNISCITISKRLLLEEFHSYNVEFGLSSETGWKGCALTHPQQADAGASASVEAESSDAPPPDAGASAGVEAESSDAPPPDAGVSTSVESESSDAPAKTEASTPP